MGTFPHKHLKKGETYHLIKGKMACVVFKNNGSINYAFILKPNDITILDFSPITLVVSW